MPVKSIIDIKQRADSFRVSSFVLLIILLMTHHDRNFRIRRGLAFGSLRLRKHKPQKTSDDRDSEQDQESVTER